MRGSDPATASTYALIRVPGGFLNPCFLLTGLLDKFDEDWQKMIGAYHGLVESQPNDTLEAIRASRLVTWLMWGPSVPICGCDQWWKRVFYQLGYGDEDNSILVLANEEVRERYRTLESSTPRETGTPLALAVDVCGTVGLTCYHEQEDVCAAQRELAGDADMWRLVVEPKGANNVQGWLHPDEGRDFYTAYVWIMFMLCNEEGAPIDSGRRYKALFPVFQHGNIANASTYSLLKQTVAGEALATFRWLKDHRLLTNNKICYVCALDDTGCGKIPLYEDRTEPILYWLEKGLKNDTELQEVVIIPETKRRKADPNVPGDWGHYSAALAPYSSCHMHEIMSQFVKEVIQAAG